MVQVLMTEMGGVLRVEFGAGTAWTGWLSRTELERNGRN